MTYSVFDGTLALCEVFLYVFFCFLYVFPFFVLF